MTLLLLFLTQLPSNIYWHENNQLSWDDFLASEKEKYTYDAESWTGFNYSYSGEYDETSIRLTVSVVTTFNRDKSWVKKEKKSDKLLRHEQLHFDITELVSRQIRKEIMEYRFSENFRKEINQIHNKYEKIRAELQNEYDRDTDHSNIEDKQAKWEKDIAKKLESLEKYSNVEFVVEVDL